MTSARLIGSLDKGKLVSSVCVCVCVGQKLWAQQLFDDDNIWPWGQVGQNKSMVCRFVIKDT